MSAPQIFQTQCLVLRAHPGEPAVTAHAVAKGWQRLGDLSGLPAEGTCALAWGIGPGITLHYSEDESAPVSYVFVRGEAPGEATGILGSLREALNPWSLDELIEQADRAKGTMERTHAIARVVIAAPHHATAPVLRRIQAALDDDSTEIRRAGISAMLQLLWPECRPLLDTVSQWDPQRDLRKYAKAALRNFDRLGIGTA